MSDHESSELVMPFMVCESQGGPFDDEAFVAGFRCGSIDAVLSRPETLEFSAYARSPELSQLDLIAMRRHFSLEMRSEPDADAEWYWLTFKRISG